MMKRALLLSAVVAVLVVGCSRDVSTPRPEAFPRMEIYDSAYVDVDAAIPLSVNASATAEVLKNGEWIDVVYPRYGGEMSVSIVFPLEYRSLEESIENRWERMRMNIYGNHLHRSSFSFAGRGDPWGRPCNCVRRYLVLRYRLFKPSDGVSTTSRQQSISLR